MEILQLITHGEDSHTQFMVNLSNPEQLAQEFVVFSNTLGGVILVGVSDTGDIPGLSPDDIRRINLMISNTASENVKPPIHPVTEIIEVEGKLVLTIHIPEGLNKPYCTNKGVYLAKSGADKRKISQEELLRLFQSSKKLYGEEMELPDTEVENIDLTLFTTFYEKRYGDPFAEAQLTLRQLLHNMNLFDNGHLNVAGLMLFGKDKFAGRPFFEIRAISFLGNDTSGDEYRDSQNFQGNLKHLYENGLTFLLRNLRRIQGSQSVNSTGILEVPRLVLEELLINALIHRDYLINSVIRIFIFENRIELINPGKLPNNLDVAKIKMGVSIPRNPTMHTFAGELLPYRGIGTGIVRALKLHEGIEFVNDTALEQFKAVIDRPNTNGGVGLIDD